MSDSVHEFLEKQIEKASQLANAMERDRFEHIGAEKAFALLMKQMPELANNFEKRLEADAEVGRAAVHVRRYIRTVIAHIQGMCESSAAKQKNEVLICEGRAQSAHMMAATMKKELDDLNKTETAEAARIAKRSEVMFEEGRKDLEVNVEIVEPTQSTGGRRPLRAIPAPKPVAVESDEERKSKIQAAKQARKAAHRNNNGVQNT